MKRGGHLHNLCYPKRFLNCPSCELAKKLRDTIGQKPMATAQRSTSVRHKDAPKRPSGHRDLSRCGNATARERVGRHGQHTASSPERHEHDGQRTLRGTNTSTRESAGGAPPNPTPDKNCALARPAPQHRRSARVDGH